MPCDLKYSPKVYNHEDWWKDHVQYSKFRRQGIDIICASFEQTDPQRQAIGNVVVVTGWSETFLKYSELIKM